MESLGAPPAILIDAQPAGQPQRCSAPAQRALVSQSTGQMVSWRPANNGRHVSQPLLPVAGVLRNL